MSSQSPAPMIAINNVVKKFGTNVAVNDVSFDVAPGESVALWGSNGAGKTTLIRCLLGVTGFDGSIMVDGIPSRTRGRAVRARIGYVPQVMPLFDLPVGEMVYLIARLRKADAAEGLRRLEQFGLSHTRQRLVRNLSGGMRQKLALTLAMLGDPTVLVFDEPTANLDAATQKELIATLNALKQEGRTIIFTSHRWSEVRALADTVVHLEAGKAIERGSVSELAIVTDRVSLRFELAETDIERAIAVLAENNLDVMRNGNNVLVSTQDRLKAQPLQLLQDNGIRILNFDVEVEE